MKFSSLGKLYCFFFFEKWGSCIVIKGSQNFIKKINTNKNVNDTNTPNEVTKFEEIHLINILIVLSTFYAVLTLHDIFNISSMFPHILREKKSI